MQIDFKLVQTSTVHIPISSWTDVCVTTWLQPMYMPYGPKLGSPGSTWIGWIGTVTITNSTRGMSQFQTLRISAEGPFSENDDISDRRIACPAAVWMFPLRVKRSHAF